VYDILVPSAIPFDMTYLKAENFWHFR